MATVCVPMPSFAFAPRRVLGLLAGCALLVNASAQTPLPKESPFVSTAAPAATTAPGETHEFAGVSTLEKKTLVNIYDKQARKGKWIAVGETVDGTTVLRYDSAREQVVVRIGGVEKTLTLRKAGTRAVTSGRAPAAAVPWAAPAGWNSTPPSTPPVTAGTATASTAAAAAQPTGPVATSLPAVNQPPPPAPGTTAYQEQEARMLVSDLLEIGMAQRKAYEEAQKKSAAGQTSPATAPTAPANTPSTAAPAEPSAR